ncbi:virulence-associated E family protein [Schleiferilactobacillus harbinensis]|jgi:predicted P-loop ATPase|uniref:virulence-associated E family protein n=1 Tax=Schleiferilactobacillus harbinensis TaxID=304207 RepID=UPI002673FE90|nr:virulence-associated E family protein [Schleiferilactobacillus harbinensis]
MVADKEAMEALAKQQRKVVPMGIKFRVNDKGYVIPNSIRNVALALEHDPLLMKVFRYNEFTHEIDVTKGIKELHIAKGQMVDDYVSLCLSYIEGKYHVLFNDKVFNAGLVQVSRDYAYNPLKEYMEDALRHWDGKTRADSFLPVYLGAEMSPVTTLITKLFFVGAVGKVYKPTMKFDFVLDLVGGQGAGKTTLLKRMGGAYYTDQFTDFKDKDSYAIMLRALILNDDEMTATNNSSFEDLKKFVSAEQLEFRFPYNRRPERRAKSFVMARTTNEDTYLKDKTGERRFLPIMARLDNQVKHPVTELTPEIVQQMWGEFVSYYKNGFSFALTKDQVEMLEEHRKEFMYVDAVEDQIDRLLSTWSGDFITSNELAREMGEKNLVSNRTLAKKIKYVMDNRRDWESKKKKIDGISTRGYERKGGH